MTMMTDILTSLGLTPEQVDIYESLLTHGPQTAGSLAKTTQVQRTYIYRVAGELVTKGLVAIDKKGKTSLYIPQSPDHLLTQAEEMKSKATQAQKALEGILPSLKTKYQAIETRPLITYYEGIEGLNKIFQDIYAPKSEPVYGCVDLEKAQGAVDDKIMAELIPLRIRNNVKAMTLLAESEKAEDVHKKDGESLRESVLLDKKDYPMPAEIDVYEDKIAMLSYHKGEFVGALIQNRDIATSLKSIFRLAFEAKKK